MTLKILQISHKPPFPKVDGGCIEIAKMSDFYSSNLDFELTVFTLSTEKHPFEIKEFEQILDSSINLVAIPIPTKPTLFGAIQSLILNSSYNLNRFYNQEIESELTELIEENDFDFIQFESIYTGQYFSFLKPKTKAKLILNAPNVEYKLWQQNVKEASFLKKWYYGVLSKQLKKRELEIWGQMDGIICITEEIKNSIVENNIKTPTLNLPFKLNTAEYYGENTTNSSPSFFHIGAMDWLPNKEGIDWFVSEVWNSLPTSNTLHLAGKGMVKNDYKSDKIKVHGFVEDAKTFMNSHDVMIVPLLTGSGMRIKIIEAMALGKCVISTSKGAEGINYTDKKNILIANTTQEFIDTIKLVEDLNLLESIGEKAQKLVQEEYNSEEMSNELTPFLKSLK